MWKRSLPSTSSGSSGYVVATSSISYSRWVPKNDSLPAAIKKLEVATTYRWDHEKWIGSVSEEVKESVDPSSGTGFLIKF